MSTQPSSDASPTNGYRLNHFMLRISNPTRTLHFYTTLMGMRIVFTRNVGPITVYCLGYLQTASYRANPKTYAAETSKHEVLTSTLGLLELVHFRTKEEDDGAEEGSGQAEICTKSGDQGRLGFNHLGFTVLDVGATVHRLRGDVQVVKDVGERPNEVVPITRWERQNGASERALSEGFGRLFKQLGFVRDPDGYLVELLPQVLR
ncbi:uncharacterized protein M421DRAFT_931 [Didymella exigua CBS 183.55]|uniref:VOC domain-containing protein n=1 Tax=Didymella exigua CBS 183.55 TaxID=1150837 RepID=A0A6A5S4W6_9PLEO|nr:uncharacterized protein M421DRAFT_931 [Didymella exigua CBS 183.55]KAF1933536.1 hypothetical protein M421DRAFT_931 [Didymella exigua CBS 183.55]